MTFSRLFQMRPQAGGSTELISTAQPLHPTAKGLATSRVANAPIVTVSATSNEIAPFRRKTIAKCVGLRATTGIAVPTKSVCGAARKGNATRKAAENADVSNRLTVTGVEHLVTRLPLAPTAGDASIRRPTAPKTSLCRKRTCTNQGKICGVPTALRRATNSAPADRINIPTIPPQFFPLLTILVAQD